jgi:hypothetical protein
VDKCYVHHPEVGSWSLPTIEFPVDLTQGWNVECSVLLPGAAFKEGVELTTALADT